MRATDTRINAGLKTYDDGFGSLWVVGNIYGHIGVVRARFLEEAYEIALDEFHTPLPPGELPEAYGLYIVREGDGYTVRDDDTPVIGPLDTREKATVEAMKFAECTERELAEGYNYQSNATGTGVVYTEDMYIDELRCDHDIDVYLTWYVDDSELELEYRDALNASVPGQSADEAAEAIDAIKAIRVKPYMREQLDELSDDYIRGALEAYGAWEEDELEDRKTNEARLIWIAACNIREDSRV